MQQDPTHAADISSSANANSSADSARHALTQHPPPGVIIPSM